MSIHRPECIWTEAGILENQLCPLQYNCDQCEIHARFTAHLRQKRGGKPAESYLAVNLPLEDESSFEAGYRYLPGWLWIRTRSSDRVRLGLHPFLWRLLPPIEKILPARVSQRVKPGDCLFWLHINGGTVCFRSPLEGYVAEHNPLLQGDISNPLALHYSSAYDNWLLDLQIEKDHLSNLQTLQKQSLLERLLYQDRFLHRLAGNRRLNCAYSLGQDVQDRVLNKFILSRHNFSGLLKKFTDDLAFLC